MTRGNQRRNAVRETLESRPPIAYAGLAVTLCAHVIVLVTFLSAESIPRPLEIRYHAFVLLGLSAPLSIISFFVDSRSIYLIVAAGRLLLALVFGVRFAGMPGLRLPLVASLAVELAMYTRFPLNGFLGTGAGASAAVFYLFFDRLRPESGAESMFVLFVVGALAWFASYAGKYREKLVSVANHATRLDQVIEELSASNLRLQQLAFRAGEQSKESERNRITREIHDAVGYTLTNLVMMMEAATDIAYDDPVRLTRLMQDARDQAKAGLDDTRRALGKLRQPREEAPQGVQAYERLFQTFEAASSLTIHADYGNFPITFGEEIDSVVYRFVQEGLTNAIRHGRSSRIDVVFWRSGRRLSVTMTDNGIGTKTVKPGIGITGMRERAARFGGTVTAGPVYHGFEIRMVLYLPEENDGQDSGIAG